MDRLEEQAFGCTTPGPQPVTDSVAAYMLPITVTAALVAFLSYTICKCLEEQLPSGRRGHLKPTKSSSVATRACIRLTLWTTAVAVTDSFY